MDVLALAGRVTLCLVAVLGLMWLLARASRKPLAAKATGPLAVLARQQLSRTSSVAVVRVADKALVVGVTDAQVTLLGETDLAAVTEALAPVETVSRTPLDLSAAEAGPETSGALTGSALSPATWKQAIDTLRERTARSS